MNSNAPTTKQMAYLKSLASQWLITIDYSKIHTKTDASNVITRINNAIALGIAKKRSIAPIVSDHTNNIFKQIIAEANNPWYEDHMASNHVDLLDQMGTSISKMYTRGMHNESTEYIASMVKVAERLLLLIEDAKELQARADVSGEC